MSNTTLLRKFNTKDVKLIEECLEIIPVVLTARNAKEILLDNMSLDMENEIALAITIDDVAVGGINAILAGDSYLLSIYVSPKMQNKGIATKGIKLFEKYVKDNFPDIQWIEAGTSRPAMKSVFVKLGYCLEYQHEDFWCVKALL